MKEITEQDVVEAFKKYKKEYPENNYTITFRLLECHSLKEKRRIVKAVIAQLRNHFNASVAEVADNDVHQRAVVGFSLVG